MDELAKLTCLNNELSADLEQIKTEKFTLIAQINESVETIRKIESDKAGIANKLEDAQNGMSHLQAELNTLQTRLETTEKEIEGMQSKIKEHENSSEGNATKNA